MRAFVRRRAVQPLNKRHTQSNPTQKTGSHRHYACTAGPSNGGCSANATYWPEAEISGQCGACCDLRSCAAPLECAKSCTPFECEQVRLLYNACR